AGVGEDLGAARVDVGVGPRIELGGRIVREAGEVDHRVAAVEDGAVERPEIALDEVDLVRDPGESFVAEVELVEDADRLALVEELADRDAADVAGAPGDENHRAIDPLSGVPLYQGPIRFWSRRTECWSTRAASRQSGYSRPPSSRTSAVSCSSRGWRRTSPRADCRASSSRPSRPARAAASCAA